MIINIESGNFNKITQNSFDIILDKDSIKKGEQVQEKMVSGLYLEELTRIVLVDLIKKGFLFRGEAARKVMEIDPDDGVVLYNCAGTYACLGMKEEALKYLQKALERGMANIFAWVKGDPYLKPLRDLPEFQGMLSKYSV